MGAVVKGWYRKRAADVEKLWGSEIEVDRAEGSLQILWLLLPDGETRRRELNRIFDAAPFRAFHDLLPICRLRCWRMSRRAAAPETRSGKSSWQCRPALGTSL